MSESAVLHFHVFIKVFMKEFIFTKVVTDGVFYRVGSKIFALIAIWCCL